MSEELWIERVLREQRLTNYEPFIQVSGAYEMLGEFEASELRDLLTGVKVVWPDGRHIHAQRSRKWLEALINEEFGETEIDGKEAWFVTKIGRSNP